MRIGIDLSVISERRTGIGNYAFNVARELLRLDTMHEWVMFFNNLVILNEVRNLARSFRVPQDDNFILLPAKKIPFWNSHVTYARIMEKERLDVLHGVANSVPLFWNKGDWGDRGNRGGAKTVITLHDLAIYRHPEWFPRFQWLATKIVVPASIKKAAKIIVPSVSTKEDLQELFGVSEEKIAVIAEGVGERFFRPSVIPAKAGIQDWIPNQVWDDKRKKYILFVGTLEPRKNLARVIEAYQGLPPALKNEYELWVAGSAGHAGGYSRGVRGDRGHKGGDGVKYLGYVEGDVLPGLYQNAALFVYPSLYEGFGLPVLEAMAGGCPVIASKTITGNFQFQNSKESPLPNPPPQGEGKEGDGCVEGGQNPVVLAVDPYSMEEIRGAMIKILTNPDMAREMGRRGRERARQFTWEKTARQTLEVYESL